MASEYFSTLQYIWLNIVFFVFSLFLFAVCLYACLFVRWVYKRRLRQKTDEMIEAYKGEEEKRKEIEINLKKQELDHPEKKKKSTTKHRNIHIVTKPCNHIIQKNSRELIVQQVNENIPNDEVSCEPVGQPTQQQFQQPLGQMVNPQNIHTMDEFQQQFVLVPVEMLKKGGRVRKARSSGLHPERHEVESVGTQTSDRSDEESQKGPQSSEDWLAGYDERDGERIDVIDDYDEQESENFMKRRRQTEAKKSRQNHADVASDETRVSIESDAPPSPPKDVTASESGTSSVDPTSSGSTTTPTDSSGPVKDSTGSGTSSVPSAPGADDKDGKKGSPPKKEDKSAPGNDSAPSDPKDSGSSGPTPDESKDPKADKKDDKGDPNENKSYVASQYYGQPGENTSALSSNNATPPPKSSSPASRPSIFPYWVDPKAPTPNVSTSKASSKLTEPELDVTDSSCALYRNKKKRMPSDSAKVYLGTPKAKTPK